MKRICFTYQMSKPHESVESCITLPIPEDIAPEILEKGGESQFLGSNSVLTNVFINLAWLQGYTFAGVVAAEEERTNEVLTEEQALSDIRQYLEQQSDQYFADRRITKAEVLADTELLTQLAGRHHCLVNMFAGNREESCMSACDDNPGINMDEVYLMSGSVKKEFFCGTPADCEKFCEEHNWSYVDENAFEWKLALKSDVGSIKPTLAQRIQNAASQAGKGVHDELSSSKHRDDGR